MACIVKRPVDGGKGLLVITDAELRGWLHPSPALRAHFKALQQHWLIAVHGNSAICQTYAPDDLIAAYIAGPGDIIAAGSQPLEQIAMDCSNFSPAVFATDGGGKFWDVLFVSRNQPFKSLDTMFQIVRRVFDQEPMRVLAIIAHQGMTDIQASEPLRLYARMFNEVERKLFTVMAPWVDYPFPFDLPTLAQFYHRSRVFLHVAGMERHPRVVGYAWAAGLPVVGPPAAAVLLPPGLAQPPGFFAFDTVAAAASQLRLALDAPALPASYSAFHLASFQVERFKTEIRKLYERLRENFAEGGWELDSLDLRLACHHDARAGTNSYGASLYQFASLLAKPLPDVTGPQIEMSLNAAACREADSALVVREMAAAKGGALRRMVRAARYAMGGR
jgi:hypothetical protein